VIKQNLTDVAAKERRLARRLSVRGLTASYHQWIFPLDPGGPGVKLPSSGTFSPGTLAWFCDVDGSLIVSSDDAQAVSRNAAAKNRIPHNAKRLITGTNLTVGMFDASRTEFGRFCCDKSRHNGSQISFVE
jgi:hypothetical protein